MPQYFSGMPIGFAVTSPSLAIFNIEFFNLKISKIETL
jgi:hypothetical protein